MAVTTAPALAARDRSFRDFFLETIDDAYAFCLAGDTGSSSVPAVLGAAYASYEADRAGGTGRTLLGLLTHVRRARLECPGPPISPATAFEGRDALRWLPELQSTTLQLCDRLGHTCSQAGIVLGCSEAEVATTLELARRGATAVSHALALWNGGRPLCNRLASWVGEESRFDTDLVPPLLLHANKCRMCSFVIDKSVDPVSDLASAGPDLLPSTTRSRISEELQRRRLLADPSVGAHGIPPRRRSPKGSRALALALSVLLLTLAGTSAVVLRRHGTGPASQDLSPPAAANADDVPRDLGDGPPSAAASDPDASPPAADSTPPPPVTAAPPLTTTLPTPVGDRPLVPDRTVRFDAVNSTVEVLRPPGATPALYRITLTWWSNGDTCGVSPSFGIPRGGLKGSGQAVFEDVPTGSHTISVECRSGAQAAAATEPLLLP
ncbi:MAG: hypothetical protein IT198_09845 [Acidimicrobiia bacterium]|nr:hypothetical protein [Acidimicrobiia bacterium]